ncbi:MAG: TSUP family transporter, partial [Methylophilaceae bacterium]
HYNLGHVDFILLGTLLLGSIPGIWVGSFLSSKIDENKLRYVLVIVLILIGIKLIINF